MTNQIELNSSFTLPGTSMTVNRMGYGAMQLAGPHVWGPPRDVDVASLFCVKQSHLESTTSTPATSTVRTSSTRSSSRRSIRIQMAW
jgi:hypothetical protein